MLDQLWQLAGPTIEFIIQPHDDTFKRLLAGADALIFPGVEDFGMIAIETMASGTPVIAFKGGGALDFIEEGRTGLFFDEQHPESLVQRLESFQNHAFSREELQNFSKKFDEHQFKEKIMSEIRSL